VETHSYSCFHVGSAEFKHKTKEDLEWQDKQVYAGTLFADMNPPRAHHDLNEFIESATRESQEMQLLRSLIPPTKKSAFSEGFAKNSIPLFSSFFAKVPATNLNFHHPNEPFITLRKKNPVFSFPLRSIIPLAFQFQKMPITQWLPGQNC
jgi:hypothetical protein